MVSRTVDFSKKAGRGVVKIAGKASKYAVGIGSLVVKDVKKLPSAVSRAVRSKIEINIILPENKPQQPTEDQDAGEVINS